MAFKWDKEKVILSVAGSLVTVVLGYLVWRHENSVTQAEAATASAQASAQDDEIQQELAALPQYAQGGGTSGDDGDTGADSNTDSAAQDDNLLAILQAFGYGAPVTQPTSPTTPVTPPTTPAPPTTPGTPVGTPSKPTTPKGVQPVGPEPVTNPVTVVPPNPSQIITKPVISTKPPAFPAQ
jgi:hypothetical protein